jgi:hypothetical protein
MFLSLTPAPSFGAAGQTELAEHTENDDVLYSGKPEKKKIKTLRSL